MWRLFVSDGGRVMVKHKIVVLDGYTENPGDLSWEKLEALGELTVYDRTSYAESDLIAERIGDADIAVVKADGSWVIADDIYSYALYNVLYGIGYDY